MIVLFNILLWFATGLISVGRCELTTSNLNEDLNSGALIVDTGKPGVEQTWAFVKKGLQENRRSMCSFLLLQVSSKRVELTLDKVTELFEQALDNMVKSTEYTTLIAPFIKPGTIEEFDRNGGATVLQISEERRELIAEYKKAIAENVDEETKAAILEKYFLKACAQKLGTVIAERSLYSTVLKVENIIEKKPLKYRDRLPSISKLTSYLRWRQNVEPEKPNLPGVLE